MHDPWTAARADAIAIGHQLRHTRDTYDVSLTALAGDLGAGFDAPLLSRVERGIQIPDPAQATVIHEWLLQRDVTVVDPVARRTDPDTSHAAAKSVRPETIRGVHRWWMNHLASYRGRELEQLTFMGLPCGYDVTDEGAFGIYSANTDMPCSESGFRTRRSELVRSGFVADTGKRFEISTGRLAIAWCLTDSGLEALRGLRR